jgi:hypothetical protein
VLSWNEYFSKVFFAPTVMKAFLEVLVFCMILFYLFVESEYIFDLNIS